MIQIVTGSREHMCPIKIAVVLQMIPVVGDKRGHTHTHAKTFTCTHFASTCKSTRVRTRRALLGARCLPHSTRHAHAFMNAHSHVQNRRSINAHMHAIIAAHAVETR